MTIEYLTPILQALHSGEFVWARTNDPSAIKQGGWEPIDGIELTVADGFVLLNVEVGSDTYEIAEAKDIVIGQSARVYFPVDYDQRYGVMSVPRHQRMEAIPAGHATTLACVDNDYTFVKPSNSNSRTLHIERYIDGVKVGYTGDKTIGISVKISNPEDLRPLIGLEKPTTSDTITEWSYDLSEENICKYMGAVGVIDVAYQHPRGTYIAVDCLMHNGVWYDSKSQAIPNVYAMRLRSRYAPDLPKVQDHLDNTKDSEVQ